MITRKDILDKAIYLGPYKVAVLQVDSKKEYDNNSMIAKVGFLEKELDFNLLNKLCIEYTINFDEIPWGFVDFDKLSLHPFNDEMGKSLYG